MIVKIVSGVADKMSGRPPVRSVRHFEPLSDIYFVDLTLLDKMSGKV